MKPPADPAKITYPGFRARKAGFRIWHERGHGWGFTHPDGRHEPAPFNSYEAAASAADEVSRHA